MDLLTASFTRSLHGLCADFCAFDLSFVILARLLPS